MAYLPDGTPLPHAGPDDAPYWQFCRERTLRIQRCTACGLHRHPPGPCCPRCGSFEHEWAPVSGRGSVFSWTVVHHPVHPAHRGAVPYNVAVVLLDGADEVRLVSNVIDAAPGEMRIGLPVEVVFEDAGEGWVLPRFRKS
jgi:uncharacterized OB-fold protein